MINFQAMRYLRQVRKCLPCSGKAKKKIIGRIRDNLTECFAENPSIDYVDLTERLGTPQQIACAFVEAEGAQELLRSMQIKRRVICIAASTALAIIVIWAGVVGAAAADFFDADHGITYVYLDSLE